MLKANEKRLINRLHVIQGQMGGLERMVEKKEYCVDIITQSLAIQKSLQSFNQAMLENHLEEHVAHQFKHGDDSKAIKELVKIYSLSKK
jgi:DNA-binding FrmR family transcriptional regulator